MIVREVNLAMLVVKRCFTFLIPAMEGRGIMELSLRMRSGEAVEGGRKDEGGGKDAGASAQSLCHASTAHASQPAAPSPLLPATLARRCSPHCRTEPE